MSTHLMTAGILYVNEITITLRSILSSGIMKHKKLRHRNELNATLMAMSTPAKRLAYLAMIQLPYDEVRGVLTFDPDVTFKISAKEYAAVCEISTSQAYKQLKEAVDEIQGSRVKILTSKMGEDLDFKDESEDAIVIFSVADYCIYSDGNGYVKLRWHRKMKPFISDLERKYTTQYLLSAVRLPIGNANNLYLLLRERISSGQTQYFDIEFNNLKEILAIDPDGSYAKYEYFHDAFFKRSAKQILEKTEFTKLDIEILERVNRRAHLLRVSYEHVDFKVSLTDKEQSRAENVITKAARSGSLSQRAIEMMNEVESLKK